jgi:hypothetical protein
MGRWILAALFLIGCGEPAIEWTSNETVNAWIAAHPECDAFACLGSECECQDGLDGWIDGDAGTTLGISDRVIRLQSRRKGGGDG